MLCDTPCYTASMTCQLENDILLIADVPAGNYRIMMEDAFGAKRISDTVSPDVDGTITIPLDFINSWVDLGAQLTITILDEDNNAAELTLGEPPTDPEAPPITCVLLIFATDGATDIE